MASEAEPTRWCVCRHSQSVHTSNTGGCTVMVLQPGTVEPCPCTAFEERTGDPRDLEFTSDGEAADAT